MTSFYKKKTCFYCEFLMKFQSNLTLDPLQLKITTKYLSRISNKILSMWYEVRKKKKQAETKVTNLHSWKILYCEWAAIIEGNLEYTLISLSYIKNVYIFSKRVSVITVWSWDTVFLRTSMLLHHFLKKNRYCSDYNE